MHFLLSAFSLCLRLQDAPLMPEHGGNLPRFQNTQRMAACFLDVHIDPSSRIGRMRTLQSAVQQLACGCSSPVIGRDGKHSISAAIQVPPPLC